MTVINFTATPRMRFESVAPLADGIVVGGSFASVMDDSLPFTQSGLQFVLDALASKPLLGVCYGVPVLRPAACATRIDAMPLPWHTRCTTVGPRGARHGRGCRSGELGQGAGGLRKLGAAGV